MNEIPKLILSKFSSISITNHSHLSAKFFFVGGKLNNKILFVIFFVTFFATKNEWKSNRASHVWCTWQNSEILFAHHWHIENKISWRAVKRFSFNWKREQASRASIKRYKKTTNNLLKWFNTKTYFCGTLLGWKIIFLYNKKYMVRKAIKHTIAGCYTEFN